MKKSTKIIIISSTCALVLGILALILGLSLTNKNRKEDLYQKGLKHLIDAEYKEATEIFAKPVLKNYKDSPKKYIYSSDLEKYEQRAYSYEDLINYGLTESGSVAIVDFNCNGGTSVPRKTITEKKDGVYITETTSKDHYDFLSWRLNYACYELSSDSIRYYLESNFDDHCYQITYELDDGNPEDRLPNNYLYNHGDISIPNLSKVGHTFKGYESDLYAESTKNFVIPNGTFGDLNLTAKFEANTYHVTFDVMSYECDVTYGEDVTSKMPSPSKSFYTFDGWTYQGKLINLTSWNIDHDVELVAKFSPIEYRITYDLHGAKYLGLPESYNTESDIDLPFVEKNDAVFIGWLDDHGFDQPNPTAGIHHGSHDDRTIEAIFVDATIEDGVLLDVANHDIKNIVIPSYVTDISPDLFPNLTNLLKIYVDAKNDHFKVVDNLLIKDNHILFAQAQKYVEFYPVVNIPNEVNEIGVNAFKGSAITTINGSTLLTKINSGAFNGCASLEEVNFKGIKYIGADAFKDTKVTNDFLEDNKYSINFIGSHAFDSTKISQVELYSNIKQIGDYAFANLSDLTEVNIHPDPSCVFGEKLFDGCTNLVSLISDSRFFETLMSTSLNDVPLKSINLDGNTNIKDNICKNYSSLETLILSNSTISQIGASAFKNNSNLKTAVLPTSLVRINASAFEDCEKLDNVNFNELTNLFSIREYAFKGAKFSELDFTNNPHLTIEDHAFNSNSELNEITMYHGQIVTRVADVFDLCHKIENITYKIPQTSSSVVELPNFLFENLNNVETITIEYLGSEDKEIKFGMYAFKGDAGLKDVVMNNCHTTIIPKHCFEGCVSLTNESLTFSNMVHYDEGAFIGCVNLAHMSFTGTTIIGDDAFAGCYSLCPTSEKALVIPRIEGHMNFGIGVFADITGYIKFEGYTQAEVEDLMSSAHKWWGFNEGFSGTFIYD